MQTCELSEPIGYNITHDNGLIAMAYAAGADLHPDPPAHRMGIDVMLLQLPRRTTYEGFVESVSDQVRSALRIECHLSLLMHRHSSQSLSKSYFSLPRDWSRVKPCAAFISSGRSKKRIRRHSA